MSSQEIETVQPPVANQVPGEVVLRDPPKKKPAAAPEAPKRPKCFSAFHDRPLVALGPKPTLKAGAKPTTIEAADEGPFDTKRLAPEFFHEGGKCPCKDGEPVSEAHRAKQVVRIARRDPAAFVPQSGPTE